MNILKQQLLIHKGFLRLTQENPSEIASSYQLEHNHLRLTLKDTGVLVIEPEKQGCFDIIVSSGIHGNETAPIEICDLLIKEILTGSLTVNNRILFILGNPQAINSGKRYEIENMNRLFCGKHQGKDHLEARRVEKLERFTNDFFHREAITRENSVERCHFDLHTAIRSSKYEKFVIYPFQNDGNWNRRYLNFFKQSDINTILLAHQSASTFSYFTSQQFNANAFTVELGQVKPFGKNNMHSFSGIIQSLRSLISNTYVMTEKFDNDQFNLFKVVDEVIRPISSRFSLNIDSDVANFTTLPLGFQLTTDDDQGYQIKADLQTIVFPNAHVPVGQRVALITEKTVI